MSRAARFLRSGLEFAVVAVCTLAFCLATLGVAASYAVPNGAGRRDYVEYWAAAQQLTRHANAYDRNALGEWERSAGYPKDIPVMVPGNAPWALALVLPLGWLSAGAGEAVWVATIVGALLASVTLIRRLHAEQRRLFDAIAYAFAPVMACILAGQLACFMLLGVVLFFRWRESRPFAAGAALWLCLLKPHLFLVFSVPLLGWIVLRRKFRMLAGSAVALLASSLLVTVFDPQVWTRYRQAMLAERLDRLPLACLSSALRQWIAPHSFFIQCLPVLLCSAGALTYFLVRRREWNWLTHGCLLLMVSVLAAPYTWFPDQAVLLPAILSGVYRAGSRPVIAAVTLMSAAVDIEITFNPDLLHSNAYLWTMPCWLLWYLVATRAQRSAKPPDRELSIATA